MPVHCEIVAQDRSVWSGEADMVVIPGTSGDLGILPNHAPLLTTLRYGFLRVRRGKQEEIFTVAGGVAEVRPDRVTVLADVAEHVDEIDEQRAEAARRRAEELLKKGPPPDPETYLRIQAALRRASLRLEAVRRYRRVRRPGPSMESGGED
ncbi:MAG TPA: ATP synthase F1 subunit epsilon [Anaerolineae bacterium]|nr:ATP synthase F1 subunit epsilon [Anaerolineae bacterium]HID84944.1 ATP synthase F1 subunit epsilon [Anaerolineales bacterium]HIQ08359.1 ATP synthase F1 subunit epsilon [Anaerolineaceae bacterium]